MLRAARARQFDVVLVDDLSRLSRDSMKTEEARRLFVFLKVRLIGISDGIDTAAKGHKALSGFKGRMNDIFLDDLRDKTHRGLAGHALKGNNTGGRNYGYKHVPTEHPTEKDEYGRPRILAVRRVIDEVQATWVRKIFEWYAEGKSPRQIAHELNQRKVPSPGASYHRKKPCARYGTWAASVLHGELHRSTGILTNPIYIGRMIWNRREWVRDPETSARNRSCARNPSGSSRSSRTFALFPRTCGWRSRNAGRTPPTVGSTSTGRAAPSTSSLAS